MRSLRSVYPVLIGAMLVFSCDRGGEPKESEESKDASSEVRASSSPSGTAKADDKKAGETSATPETIVIPPAKPLSGTTPTLTAVDEATKQTAAELAKQRERTFFPAAIRKPLNGPAFLHLAVSSSDPAELEAVLGAIETIYGDEDDHRTRKVDDDYRAVILYRLASKDPQIAEAAFGAALRCVGDDPANAEVIAALVNLAYHHPQKAGRALALKALSPRWKATEPVQDAFLHALEDRDPAFVALTLEQISFNFGSRFSKHEALRARIVPLLKHSDPAVRATAVAALAESSVREDREQTAAELLPLLEDPHPFVRAAVINEMGTLRHLAALETVLAQVESADPAKHKIPWVGLDGVEKNESLLLHKDTVGLVALKTLKRLTKATEHPFELSGLGAKDADGGLAQGAKEARAWFAAHGSKLTAQGS